MNKIYNITLHCTLQCKNGLPPAHIIECSGTVEPQMLIRIQFWELTSLFLKESTYFLRSSSKEGMLRHTNISLALLYFGMPNSFLNRLFYAILKIFNAVLEQSYHNMENTSRI